MQKFTKIQRFLCVMFLSCAVVLGGAGFGLAQTKNISIGTGSMSGTYYPLGVAMAKMWSAADIGLNVGAESTGGSVENSRHLKKGNMEVAFVESMTTRFRPWSRRIPELSLMPI